MNENRLVMVSWQTLAKFTKIQLNVRDSLKRDHGPFVSLKINGLCLKSISLVVGHGLRAKRLLKIAKNEHLVKVPKTSLYLQCKAI